MTDPTNKKSKKAASNILKDRLLRMLGSVKEYAAIKPGHSPETYSAIGGTKAPPESQLLAMAIFAILRIAAAVLLELEKKAKKGATAFFRATISLPIFTSLDRIEIDVTQLRKLRNDLKKSGIKNAVGMVQLRAWPEDNRQRCKIQPQIELIVFGQDLESTYFDAARERMEERYDTEGETIRFEHIEPTRAALQAAVAQVFDLSEGDNQALEAQAKELGIKGWLKRKPRRDFIRFMALALVPFKGMTIAVGDGQRLIDKAIVDGKSTIENMVERCPQVIHRDAISRFFSAELVRLGMKKFMMPFIRYR